MSASGASGESASFGSHALNRMPERLLKTRSGRVCDLPLFLPVYQPGSTAVPLRQWVECFGIEGCMVNAYFLYKNRASRRVFEAGMDIHDYLQFQELVMTDSGAFQGLTGRLLLKNEDIVIFQDRMGADIISPLDVITPPGDGRRLAEKKLRRTTARVRKAKELIGRATLAGVQQGGRFLDLRRRSVEDLMEIGVEYIAIGSLVPFFTRNHDLRFVGAVLREAREVAGKETPIHVYGAGDPVELPFMSALGADIFDSSSYVHFAKGGWYMTPYGAVSDETMLSRTDWVCTCCHCSAAENVSSVFAEEHRLAAHNLWTILETVRRLRVARQTGTLERLLQDTLHRHMRWFPDSQLGPSWESLHG